MFADDLIQNLLPNKHKYANEQAIFEGLSKAARFKFDRSVVEAAQSVAYTSLKSILDALPLARLPAPTVWIEWSETERLEFRNRFPDKHEDDGKKIPHRMGLLLTELPSQGFEIRLAFTVLGMSEPEYGMGYLTFTPDSEDVSDIITHPEFLSAKRVYGKSSEEIEAAALLSAKVDHHIAASMRMQMAQAAVRDPSAIPIMEHCIEIDQRNLQSESIFAISCLLLLNSRNALSYTEPDLSKLNLARAKRKAPPLLDHKVTTMKIGRAAQRRLTRLGANGTTPLFHWHRGHFKVRRTGVFWWNGHFRGDRSRGQKEPRYFVVQDDEAPQAA